MHADELRAYCLKKLAVTEHFPFDDVTLVFKVKNKMFALIGLERQPLSINLKCDPDYAQELREKYDAIEPGFHMSKKHWNTVTLSGDVPTPLLLELIDHSYACVVRGLPKKEQTGLLGN